MRRNGQEARAGGRYPGRSCPGFCWTVKLCCYARGPWPSCGTRRNRGIVLKKMDGQWSPPKAAIYDKTDHNPVHAMAF